MWLRPFGPEAGPWFAGALVRATCRPRFRRRPGWLLMIIGAGILAHPTGIMGNECVAHLIVTVHDVEPVTASPASFARSLAGPSLSTCASQRIFRHRILMTYRTGRRRSLSRAHATLHLHD